MNVPAQPTMRTTTAKILMILGQIDKLSAELARVAAQAEEEDGSIPYIAPEWDEVNEHFSQWLNAWFDYAFGRMKGHLIASGFKEL